MKKIELNNTTYNIPTSWDDITVQDQIRVSNIGKKYTGITSHIQLLSGYSNIPVEVLKKTHINKLPELMDNIKFINEPVNQDPIESFKHNGHKYFVLPSLINGEFQDFISLESVMNTYKDDPIQGLPLLIAIMCKRQDETLDDFDLEERAKEFLTLPFDIANRVSVFFYQIGQYSQINTPIYLETYQKEVKKAVQNQLEELENIIMQQDGQGWLGRLLKKTSVMYVKFLKKNWISY